MKVKTLKPHSNAYGDKQEKTEGDTYETSQEHALQLIASGLVEEVKDEAPPAPQPAAKPTTAPPPGT